MKISTFRIFLIKLKSWEYWPIYSVYFFVTLYWIWCSIKSRSPFYFQATNPGIKNGGFGGVSKFSILEKIHQKPISLLFEPSASINFIEQQTKNMGIYYPFIAKPDEGERGWGVKKINNSIDLENYLQWVEVPFIIQEFIDLPVEAGIFYIRYPDKDEGEITSIVIKDMLTLVGDGQSSLLELILKNDRAYLQLKRIITEGKFDLNFIPKEDEKMVLNTIGNHCLGTIFLNGEKLNTEEMRKSFDQLSKNIEGFYYGRFDVRAATIGDIEKGNVKIMELNGVNSEPAHIYQPGYSFIKGQKSLLFHWKTLYEISKINRKKGYKLIGIREGIKEVRRIFKFNKTYKIR